MDPRIMGNVCKCGHPMVNHLIITTKSCSRCEKCKGYDPVDPEKEETAAAMKPDLVYKWHVEGLLGGQGVPAGEARMGFPACRSANSAARANAVSGKDSHPAKGRNRHQKTL